MATDLIPTERDMTAPNLRQVANRIEQGDCLMLFETRDNMHQQRTVIDRVFLVAALRLLAGD